MGIYRFLLSCSYVLLLAFACLLCSCATTSDLEFLRQDVNRLQRDSQSTRDAVADLKERTAGVAKEESFNVVRMSQAEIQTQLTNVTKDIQTLSGRFDENKYSTEKTLRDWTSEMDLMKAQVASLERQMKDLKDKLAVFESQARLSAESPKEPGAEKTPGQLPNEAVSGPRQKGASDKLGQYETAYTAFKNKRYKDAREKFETFVANFPKDALADNSHFWIAETFYGEKDFEGAILSYEDFLKKYPKSRKASSALFKQGLSFVEIGDRKTGMTILEQLIERYPVSKEAELAKSRLDALRKKPARQKK